MACLRGRELWKYISDATLVELAYQYKVPYDILVDRFGLYSVPFATYSTAVRWSQPGDSVHRVKDVFGRPGPFYIFPESYKFGV